MFASLRARRRIASSGAFFFTSIVAAVALTCGGCASAKKSRNIDKPLSSRYLPPDNFIVGRVLAFHTEDNLALVELSLVSAAPFDLNGRELVTRNPTTLAPTARLQASPYRRSRVMGATIVSGTPVIGDEVVVAALPPATPAPAPTEPAKRN